MALGKVMLTSLGLSLILVLELSSAIIILNEELLDIPDSDRYQIRPDKRAGAYSSRAVPANAPCRDCLSLAKYEYDRFKQYTYLNYYEGNPNVTNYDQLAGIKTCRELANVLECYDRCFAESSEAEIQQAKVQIEYRSLAGIQGIYCEGRYTPGHASCRLADTHRCDRIRRNSCGDTLEEYSQCVHDILATSGQSCDGDCTPARRYLKSQRFMWQIECLLRATFKSQCKDIVTIFCFEEVKDSDLNYGIYQRMDTIPAMADNLTNTCEILRSPFNCIDTATNSFYDYFGFNVTYACRGAEDTMDEIVRKWQEIIDPFCGDNVTESYVTIADACPTPDPNNAPLEEARSVATTTTTTTQRTWEFYEAKEGECPYSTDQSTRCENLCGDDSHCGDSMKCCDRCCRMYIPATTTTTTTPATVRTVATSGTTRDAVENEASQTTKPETILPSRRSEGRCPIRVDGTKSCDAECADDSHCVGALKCCNNCCMEPLTRRTGRPNSPPKTPGFRGNKQGNSDPSTSSGNWQRFSLQLLALTAMTSFLLLCC